MSRRTQYTIITPLPPTVSRKTAIDTLHNHSEMIELNPLVIYHAPCPPPSNASAEEFHAVWYTLTDRISYLPGIKGSVTYRACFHDLPRALQTHVYAPAGLEIKEKWSIGGNEPGEEREVMELGLKGVPREGLYLREDVDMKCNFMMTSFVKKTLKKAHSVLVERLVVKADLIDDKKVRSTYASSPPSVSPSLHTAPPYPVTTSLYPRSAHLTSSPTSSSLRSHSNSIRSDYHPNPLSQNRIEMPSPSMSTMQSSGSSHTFVAELPADGFGKSPPDDRPWTQPAPSQAPAQALVQARMERAWEGRGPAMGQTTLQAQAQEQSQNSFLNRFERQAEACERTFGTAPQEPRPGQGQVYAQVFGAVPAPVRDQNLQPAPLRNTKRESVGYRVPQDGPAELA